MENCQPIKRLKDKKTKVTYILIINTALQVLGALSLGVEWPMDD
jgi:hypothetical protein